MLSRVYYKLCWYRVAAVRVWDLIILIEYNLLASNRAIPSSDYI